MKRYPSCSFSVYREIDMSDLSKKEESILEMYKKLMYSHSTQFYQVQQFLYTELPKAFPNNIKNAFEFGIFLEKFTFFEMFTMLIFQYLYSNTLDYSPAQSAHIKQQKITQLKSLIYTDWFMEGNYYMKGLLIKGFKLLEDAKKVCMNKPVAQVLLTTDIILAFTECWKELVDRICSENKLPKMQENQIDSSVFEIFASYFKLNFDVHWKEKGKKFWKEHFTFLESNAESTTVSIIVNPDNQISVSQRSIPATESRISCSKSIKSSSQIFNWNYVILIKNRPVEEELPIQNMKTSPLLSSGKSQKQSSISHKQKIEINYDAYGEEKEMGKFHNNEISRISQAEYSYGETQEIKILLQEDNNEYIDGTKKKTPKYRANYSSQITFDAVRGKQNDNQNFNADLNNIWQVIDRTNGLIDQMRKYSQFLQQNQT